MRQNPTKRATFKTTSEAEGIIPRDKSFERKTTIHIRSNTQRQINQTHLLCGKTPNMGTDGAKALAAATRRASKRYFIMVVAAVLMV